MKQILTVLFITFLLFVGQITQAQNSADQRQAPYALEPIKLQSITELGDDAIRFSSRPALGGNGYVFEAINGKNGQIWGKFTLIHGHPYSEWYKVGSIYLELDEAEYQNLLSLVEAGIVFHNTPPEPDMLAVCADGPGYFVERIEGDAKSEADIGCGNKAIDDLALAIDGHVEHGWRKLRD